MSLERAGSDESSREEGAEMRLRTINITAFAGLKSAAPALAVWKAMSFNELIH